MALDGAFQVQLRIFVALFLTAGLAATRASAAEPAPREAVVLLHGLARSPDSMAPLARRLAEAGYAVHNLAYPSTDAPPETLERHLGEQLAECCAGAPRLNFVTHSLGGILLRAHLAGHALPSLGRVVMLAPPNRGSEIVDRLGDSAAFGWALGPTAQQLGTAARSLPRSLPPVDYEVGVIAGTQSINPLGSLLLPGSDDGAVALANTRVEGMRDFIALPVSHTLIMRSDEVAEQVLHFLRSGAFRRK